MKFEMDFISSETFKLPYGYVDFREIASEENE